MAREELKQYVSLTNQAFVQWFENKVPQSNRQVENDLSDAFVSFPTDVNSVQYQSFSDAALAWIVYQWKLKQGVQNVGDFLRAYQGIIAGLRTKARSEPDTNRIPAIVIVEDPRDSKMILPSQSSIFAFDNFA